MNKTNKSASEPTISSEGVITSDSNESNVTGNGESPPLDQFGPFDPESVRIDQTYLAKGGVAKKLITTIPVRKPNNQAFIRVHSAPSYRINVARIELQEDREMYLLKPGLAEQLSNNEYHFATLFLATTRQKTVFIWPVKLPAPDARQNEWHLSAREAAELAMKRWVRIKANTEL